VAWQIPLLPFRSVCKRCFLSLAGTAGWFRYCITTNTGAEDFFLVRRRLEYINRAARNGALGAPRGTPRR